MLAVIASQALFVTGRSPPPMLQGFVDLIRGIVRPVVEDRVLGAEMERLADAFTTEIFDAETAAERAVA